MTILHALNSIAADSFKPTEHTLEQVEQLLDYMNTNPNAFVRYHASNMIFYVHSDSLFMSSGCGRSRTGGYVFLDSLPMDRTLIKLNENITIICVILNIFTASATEAELGELFLDAQEVRIRQPTMYEMGHRQP